MQDFLPPGLMVLCAALTWFASRGLKGNPVRGHGALSYAVLVAGLLWAYAVSAIGPEVRSQGKSVAYRECTFNIKRQSYALLMYSWDNDGHLPLQRWYTVTSPYRGKDSVVCPSVRPAVGYGLNDRLLGTAPAENDHKTILLGESVSREENATIHDETDLERRHNDGLNVSVADGGASSITRNYTAENLRWSLNELVDWSKVQVATRDADGPPLNASLWLGQFILLLIAYPVALVWSVWSVFNAPKHRAIYWILTATTLVLGVLVLLLMPVVTT